MDKLQQELTELLKLRDEYLKIARNEESLNDQIRELQKSINQNKYK
jgi:hypothetical protein